MVDFNRIGQLPKVDLSKDYKDSSTDDSSSIASAVKRGVAGGIEGLGRSIQEAGAPSLGKPIRSAAQALEESAGPSAIQSIRDIKENPVGAIKEAIGNVAAGFVPTAAGVLSGGAAGMALGGPPGAAIGAGLGAMIPSSIAEFGEIKRNQDISGIQDNTRATIGALGAGALDALEVGALAKVLPKGTLGKGVEGLTDKLLKPGFTGSILTRATKGALTAGGAEAIQEGAQSAIEQTAGGIPLNPEDIGLSAAMGAIGGGALGAPLGALNKQQQEKQTVIPGTQSKFTNKDIEKSLKTAEDSFTKAAGAIDLGEDHTSELSNLESLKEHLTNNFISPKADESGKTPTVHPADKIEAEAVLKNIDDALGLLNNKLKTKQEVAKPSEYPVEEIELPRERQLDTALLNPELERRARLIQEQNAKLEEDFKPLENIDIEAPLPVYDVEDLERPPTYDVQELPQEELVGKQINPVREQILAKQERILNKLLPTDLVTKSGKPYVSEGAAKRSFKTKGLSEDTHTIVETSDGFVIRQTKEVPQPAEEPQRETGTYQPSTKLEQAPISEEEIQRGVLKPGFRFRKQAGVIYNTPESPQEPLQATITPESVSAPSYAGINAVRVSQENLTNVVKGLKKALVKEKRRLSKLKSETLAGGSAKQIDNLTKQIEELSSITGDSYIGDIRNKLPEYDVTANFQALTGKSIKDALGEIQGAEEIRSNQEQPTEAREVTPRGEEDRRSDLYQPEQEPKQGSEVSPERPKEVKLPEEPPSPSIDERISRLDTQLEDINNRYYDGDITESQWNARVDGIRRAKAQLLVQQNNIRIKDDIGEVDFSLEEVPAKELLDARLSQFKKYVDNLNSKLNIKGVNLVYADSILDIEDKEIIKYHSDRGINPKTIGGLYHKAPLGKVTIYVFGQNKENLSQLQRTIFHELVGHYGVRKVLGNDWENFLDRMINNPVLASEIYALSPRWASIEKEFPVKGNNYITVKTPTGNVKVSRKAMRGLADELIAVAAGNLPKQGTRRITEGVSKELFSFESKQIQTLLQKAIQFIKHILRKIGLYQYSETATAEDILRAISRSYETLFDNSVKLNQKNHTFSEIYANIADNSFNDIYRQSMEDAAIKAPKTLHELSTEGYGDLNQSAAVRFVKQIESYLAATSLRKFMHLGGLPHKSEFIRLNQKALGDKYKVDQLTNSIKGSMRNLNIIEKEKVLDFLTDSEANAENLKSFLPEDLVNNLVAAKQKIIDYGETLVKLGLLNPETFEENKGSYIRTRYVEFLGESKGSGKLGSFQNYLKSKKELTAEQKAQYIQIRDPEFLLVDTLGTIGRDVALLKLFHNVNLMSSKYNLPWVIGGKDFIVQENVGELGNKTPLTFDDAIARLERLNDVIKNEGKLYGLDSQRLADITRVRDKLQQDIQDASARLDAKIAQFSQDEGLTEPLTPKQYQSQYYKQLPKGKRYGKLSGMYIRNEIYDDLRDAIEAFTGTGTQGDIARFLEKAHGYWKFSKVVANPAGWFRNGIGNFVLMDISSPTNSLKLGNMFYDEVTNAVGKKPSKYWTIAVDNGAFGTTYSANELYLYEKEFESEIKKLHRKYSDNPFTRLMANIPPKVFAIMEKWSHNYGLVEGSFKVVAVRDYIERWEKEKGIKFDDLTGNERDTVIASAMTHANNSIFDYSAVPSFVKFARKYPLGTPFITFIYKAFPQVIRSFVRYPQKFIKYAVLPMLMHQLFLAMNPDLDDDDYNEIVNKMGLWMKDHNSIYLLPMKDDNGKWQAVNFGYFLPWEPFMDYGLWVNNHFSANSVSDTAYSVLGATKEAMLGSLGILGGPVPTTISALISNKDPFTKQPIIPEGLPPDEKLAKMITHIWSIGMPPWLTDYGIAGKVLDQMNIAIPPISSGTKLTRYGTDKETVGQTISKAVGVNVYGFDPSESHQSNIKQFQKEEADIKNSMRTMQKNPNVPANERVEEMKKYNQLLLAHRNKVSEYMRKVEGRNEE